MPYKPKVGDKVTATLRGELIRYDNDFGWWTLKTDGSDHVPWEITLHWSQPFTPIPTVTLNEGDTIQANATEN